ncbi:MAG: hypothetical protein IAE77_08170 [Prosthecobacter sp.]|jgi:hypothetical protein|uniref:hypothetical protein n=1 Tax=Prosthecobacter sp. TaxID=1965333 RepID=UPI0019E67375|nr:hypothetical protein [Prosthecobacter sp.]MBE2283423.1 hypothetical protein [Prosthecobacter sp.]
MPTNHNISKKLMAYSEVRKGFSEALREQLQSQGPVTKAAIRKIQQSRKYAHSPVSAMMWD